MPGELTPEQAAKIKKALQAAEDRGIINFQQVKTIDTALGRKAALPTPAPTPHGEITASSDAFQVDPEFAEMGQGDDVPMLQDQSPPPEWWRKFVKGTGLPLIGGMIGAAGFPPLAPYRMLQLASKAKPKLLKDLADNFVPIPGLGPTMAKLGSEGVKKGIKFGPPVLGATLGGTAGGAIQSGFEQGLYGPDDILEPFHDLTLDDIPTAEQIDKAFTDARARGVEQGVMEIAGAAIFAPLKWILGPNAALLASQNRRVLEFARKHGLPINPRSATEAELPIVETISDLIFPAGALTNISNKKALAKVLEAPVPDHTNFVTTLFQLEKPKFIGNKGGKLIGGAVTETEQNTISTIAEILKNSSTTAMGNSGIGNLATQARSSLLINGDKLAQNLSEAAASGKLKGLDPKALEALQNYALYAKVAGEEVAAQGNKALGLLAVPGAVATTGAITYPLYTGNEGIGGTATPGEIGHQIAAQSLLLWMASSIVNPKGGMNRWLTNGFVDSHALQEMMRAAIGAGVRTGAAGLGGGNDLSLFNG